LRAFGRRQVESPEQIRDTLSSLTPKDLAGESAETDG
jgi:hypothetical protein